MTEAAARKFRSSEEGDMRNLVVPEMRRRWPGARIIHELPLRYSERRIDLAAVTETEIVSVEIKSSRDVLDRLKAQLRGFHPISDQIIVAVAPAHWTEAVLTWEDAKGGGRIGRYVTCEVDRAISDVTSGIGVWIACAETGTLSIERENWTRNHVLWSGQLLDLLHVSELIDVAERHKILTGKRPNHTTLVRQCHDHMTGREIKRAVCAALRSRAAFDKASDPPLDGGGAG